jgi:hypothetical protein
MQKSTQRRKRRESEREERQRSERKKRKEREDVMRRRALCLLKLLESFTFLPRCKWERVFNPFHSSDK